jgi:hypothetical protein
MTDTITSQNTDLSFWITMYFMRLHPILCLVTCNYTLLLRLFMDTNIPCHVCAGGTLYYVAKVVLSRELWSLSIMSRFTKQYNPFQVSTAMLMRSVLIWDIQRSCVVIDYRRFGQRIGSIFTGQECEKMGPIRWPETSVINYHTTPRNISQQRRSQYNLYLIF